MENEIYSSYDETMNTSEVWNTTTHRTWTKTFIVVPLIISSLSFILNFTIISIFLYMVYKKRRKRVNLFLCVQALTDVCVSVSMVIWFFSPDQNNHLSNKSSRIKWFSYDYSLFLAGLNLLFITTERYIAIKYPFQHRTHVTFKVISFVLFANFLLSAIPPSVLVSYILPIYNHKNRKTYKRYEIIYYSLKGVVGLVIIAFTYTLLYLSYRKIRLSARKQSTHSAIRGYTDEGKKRMKFIIVMLTMSSLYGLTCFPGAIYMFILNTMNEATRKTVQIWVIENWFNIVYFSTALLNSIVTLTFQDDYFNFLYYLILKKKRGRNGVSEGGRTVICSSQDYMVSRREMQMQKYA